MIHLALAVGIAFSPSQCQTLDLAGEIGKPYGLSDTLRALVFVESSAGISTIGDDGKSFGITQMQLATAKDVLRRSPNLWRFREKQTDGAIIRRLLSDQTWALEMAAVHLAYLRDTYDWKSAVKAYNAGETGMQRGFSRRYLKKIIKHLGVKCNGIY